MPRLPQLTARELVRFLKSRHLTLWHDARQVAVTIPGSGWFSG
ncbi:MAG: hypothetical protein ACREKS_17760 [Candidatus Rokuibacteriota bacterium]